MEIPLFVLVLQIGFNAALNNHGYNGNLLIPSALFVNSGQTRRLLESDDYQPLSSGGIPASDSEQSDDEYSSFEDYNFRSVRPLQSSPNQRRNDYLRYNTGAENDVSLESAPFGRINSNNYADSQSIQSNQSSSSLSRRTDMNFRRPFLRNGPSKPKQSQTRKYYRKANDDLSLEVSSLESSNPEDASRLGEEASYLLSLLSLFEQPNNRRGQNRKYYRKRNNLSPDVSPIDKLYSDEDTVNSLLSSPNRRRNFSKEYNNHQYDQRIREPSPVKDIPDAYKDTILLVTDDDDKPDEILIRRLKLGSLESTGLGNNNLYDRRHGLNLDDDISNNLSPFRGLKPRLRSRKWANDSPLFRRFNRKSNDNADLESLLNDELFPDDDKTGQLTLLRSASLEDLNLESPWLRSGDRKNHNDRKSNRRKFLRLSLSPNNKLTLDKGVASDLSDLVSETLDELKLVPDRLVNLRWTGPSTNKYRRENNKLSAKEDNLRNLPVLLLGSVDIPNAELPLQRYYELANHSNNRNLRKHENNKEALKKLLDNNSAKNLVHYHEVKSNKLPNNRKNEKLNNNRRDDFPDEFSLDTLFNSRKEDHDNRLDLDDHFSSNLSVLRSTNRNHLSLDLPPLRSFNDNSSKSNDADDTPHLEFPRNDTLMLNKSKTSGLKSQTQLKSAEQKDNTTDTTDTLHLEFPWNDQMSPSKDKTSNLSAVRKFKSQLRNSKEKDNAKDTTDTLHLELPCNSQRSPIKNKTSNLLALRKLKSQLRSPEEKDNTKDTTDKLLLVFPWNDPLDPENDKTSNLSSSTELKLPLRSPEEKYFTKDTTDTLHLEFPWNDPLSSNVDKGKSQLRINKQKDNAEDSTDILHLEFPWNDALSPDENKTGELKSQSPLRSQYKEPKDELKLEFPWNDKPTRDKLSSKKTAVRTPDPFNVHSYLRNRNIKKHQNYFKRLYDEFTEGIWLENLKNSPSDSHLRLNRRFNDNQSLEVLPLAGEELENDTVFRDTDEDSGAVSTFPLDRRPGRLRTQAGGTPSLLTTTERPNDTESILNLIGDKNYRIPYNDTIIFPKN